MHVRVSACMTVTPGTPGSPLLRKPQSIRTTNADGVDKALVAIDLSNTGVKEARTRVGSKITPSEFVTPISPNSVVRCGAPQNGARVGQSK